MKVLDFGLARMSGGVAEGAGWLGAAHRRAHARGHRAGNGALHVAGAGLGPGPRPPHRHLLAGRDALRDGDGARGRSGGRARSSSCRRSSRTRLQPGRRQARAAAHLGQIVGRCLEKAPADRYQTAKALLEELPSAAVAPLAPPVSGATRRRPGYIAVAAVALFALATLGYLGYRWLPPSRSRSSAPLAA